MIELLLLSLILLAFATWYWRWIGINLSVTSIFLGTIWLVYGIGYLAFSRFFGPGVFESLLPGDSSSRFSQYLICGREVSQFNFILQTSINLGIIPTFDLALCGMFFGLAMGCMLADTMCSNTPQKIRQAMQDWENTPLTGFEPSRVLLPVCLLALAFLLYFMIHDDQITKVLRYFASQAGEFEKIRMRQSAGGSSSYIFNLMLCTTLPFICFYLIALQKKGQSMLLIFALLLIALVVLAKLALLSKAPAVVFFAQMCMVLQMKRSLRISSTVFWTGLAALGALLLMAFIANPELQVLDGVGFLLYRIFIAPNEALLEYFASIPHVISHTWGHDNRFFAYFLQVPQLEATHSRVSEVYRGVKGYTTNTMFLGDAWAQFRWVGVLAASVLAGFMFRWIDIRMIVVQGKSASAIAGIVLAYFAAFTALSTALQTSFLTGGLLMVVPLVWCFSIAPRYTAPVPAR